MKKLQNDLITIDRQLVKNNKLEHKLLSSIPNITDIKVSLIVTDVIPTSVISTSINITIISRNNHIDIISNIISNIINIDYIDINLTATEILGLVVTSAQNKIISIV